MTNLIAYAEKLATDPPTKVYKKLMELFSKEQLKALGDPPAGGKQLQIYANTKAEYEAIASNWERMVNNPAYGKYGADVARFSVTAICDFVAMCMMMIAAGSARIEDLKTAIRYQKPPGIFRTRSHDLAYLIGRDDAKQFLGIMKTWGALKNNGIVQFKFMANNDFHTFAIERTPGDRERPEFIVYQGYQNTYSLSHFLHTKWVWSDEALEVVHQQRWEAFQKAEKNVYQNDFKNYGQRVLIPEMENIEFTMKWIGDRERLTYQDLNVRVLQPLAGMLDGAIPRRSYVRMTGSPSTSRTFRAPFMIVLMCDQVSPEEFKANCKELYDCPAGLTKYPECSMA